MSTNGSLVPSVSTALRGVTEVNILRILLLAGVMIWRMRVFRGEQSSDDVEAITDTLLQNLSFPSGVAELGDGEGSPSCWVGTSLVSSFTEQFRHGLLLQEMCGMMITILSKGLHYLSYPFSVIPDWTPSLLM